MLEPDFLFSQHNLGDFLDCPRRFYLRHVAKLAWPLVETGPGGMDALQYQAYLRRGAVLHRWIERYWVGIERRQETGDRRQEEGERREETGGRGEEQGDAELAVWWARFRGADFGELPPVRLPELALACAVGGYRLYARFDLLALPTAAPAEGGQRAVIVDWKTLRAENPPRHAFLRQRLQTRIYLCVLATAGAAYNGGVPFAPEQCAMRYWLANFPEQPWVTIEYSAGDYEADRRRLESIVADVASRDGEAAFTRTDDERRCTYCSYRTLCRRRGAAGGEAPDEEAPDEETEGEIDRQEAPELEY